MNYFQEIAMLGNIAKDVGVFYQHPFDQDCLIYKAQNGLVMKLPKEFLENKKLQERFSGNKSSP